MIEQTKKKKLVESVRRTTISPISNCRQIVIDSLSNVGAGSRVLAIIPEKTRDDNTHILFPVAAEILSDRAVARFDALVAHLPTCKS